MNKYCSLNCLLSINEVLEEGSHDPKVLAMKNKSNSDKRLLSAVEKRKKHHEIIITNKKKEES